MEINKGPLRLLSLFLLLPNLKDFSIEEGKIIEKYF